MEDRQSGLDQSDEGEWEGGQQREGDEQECLSSVSEWRREQGGFKPNPTQANPSHVNSAKDIRALKRLVHEDALVLNNGMSRAFSLHIGSGGKCVIKEDGDNSMSEFIDILAAVMYVRQQTGSETAVLTIYDAGGKEAFKRTL